MSLTLGPYLHFKDQCRDAMGFYQSVLGGQLKLTTFGDVGVDHPTDGNRILHARLRTPEGFVLMASDLATEVPFDPPLNSTVKVIGSDPALLGYWRGLSEESTVLHDLANSPWSMTLGMLVDRFDVTWVFAHHEPHLLL